MPFNTLLERTQALCNDTEVEAMVLVVQTDEHLIKGYPIDLVNRIAIVADDIATTEQGKLLYDKIVGVARDYKKLLK